jgi:hypothetical protein
MHAPWRGVGRYWWARPLVEVTDGSKRSEDAGGASLADLAKPLPADDLVGFGLGLARAVAGMHRRGVFHRDITPGERRGRR